MTARTDISARVSRGLLYGAGLGMLWVVLAQASSTTTFHLAPLLVAGAPPVIDASEGADGASRLVLLAVLGAVLALIFTGALSVLGSLVGPSLLPTGGAALESVVFAATGSVVGFIAALVVSRR